MPNLAGHTDGPAMRLYDRLGDRQSHSGSMYLIALPGAAIELVEDKALLQHPNSNATIGHANDKRMFVFFSTDIDRAAGSRVFRGIFQQVMQHFFDHAQVKKDWTQILGQTHGNRMRLNNFLRVLDRLIYQLLHRMQLQVQLDFVGIQLRHLHRLFNQAIETSALFVDDGQQFVPLRWGQL